LRERYEVDGALQRSYLSESGCPSTVSDHEFDFDVVEFESSENDCENKRRESVFIDGSERVCRGVARETRSRGGENFEESGRR